MYTPKGAFHKHNTVFSSATAYGNISWTAPLQQVLYFIM